MVTGEYGEMENEGGKKKGTFFSVSPDGKGFPNENLYQEKIINFSVL